MHEYRIYLVGRDGHIKSAVDLECEDDLEALRLASEKAVRPYEIWQGARRVAELTIAERTGAHQAHRT